jgi:hypothetical protein
MRTALPVEKEPMMLFLIPRWARVSVPALLMKQMSLP